METASIKRQRSECMLKWTIIFSCVAFAGFVLHLTGKRFFATEPFVTQTGFVLSMVGIALVLATPFFLLWWFSPAEEKTSDETK